MKYKRLGKHGVKVSEFCLGTMIFGSQVDEPSSVKIIKRAVDLGVNFIDTANTYNDGKTEEIVGKAIKGLREELVIATKVRHRTGKGPNDEGLSRKHILHAVEESLRRLDTHYIDIYYVHRPSNVGGQGFLPEEPVPMEETLGTLTDLVRSGKVRYIGCSNFPAWLLCKSLWTSSLRGFESYSVIQPRYNLFEREIEREIIPLCLDQGTGIVPYSPLAGGVLTGKYRLGLSPPAGSRGALDPTYIERHHWNDPVNLKILRGVEELSVELKRPMAQIALAWILSNPAITSPIVGASDIQQLENNLAATELSLNRTDLEKLDKLSPIRGPYFT